MTTWEQLRAELRERLALTFDKPRWLGFVFGGRKFAINLSNEGAPLPMIAVETVYVPEAWLKPEEALAHSRTAKVGSLHRHNGKYLARQLLPLAGLSFETLELVLRALAEWADKALPPAPEQGAYTQLFDGFVA